MAEIIEMGTISSRGQIAIPSDIRDRMGLQEGKKILFFLEGDALLIKKVESLSWAEITKPLREVQKHISENEVVDLVHQMRKEKKSKTHEHRSRY